VAPVSGQSEIEPQLTRRIGERTRLISGSRGNEQNSGHSSMLSTGQQDHPQSLCLNLQITMPLIEFSADFSHPNREFVRLIF
jgi:hypothetical protein